MKVPYLVSSVLLVLCACSTTARGLQVSPLGVSLEEFTVKLELPDNPSKPQAQELYERLEEEINRQVGHVFTAASQGKRELAQIAQEAVDKGFEWKKKLEEMGAKKAT